MLLGGQLTDRAGEFAQPFLRGGVLGFHLLLGLHEGRPGGLHLSSEVELELLEFTDLFDEYLRLGSGAAKFGSRRFEIGDGGVVGAPRDTGAGGEDSETQHPGRCGVGLHASPHCVVLHAIAQRAVSSVAPTSRSRPGYPFLQQKSLRIIRGREALDVNGKT